MRRVVLVLMALTGLCAVLGVKSASKFNDPELATESKIAAMKAEANSSWEHYQELQRLEQEELLGKISDYIQERAEKEKRVQKTQQEEELPKEEASDNSDSNGKNGTPVHTNEVKPVVVVTPEDVVIVVPPQEPADGGDGSGEGGETPSNPPDAPWGIDGESDVELDLFSDTYDEDASIASSDGRFVIGPGSSKSCSLNLLTFGESGAGHSFSLNFSLKKSKFSEGFLEKTNIVWTFGGKPAPATATAKKGSFEALNQAVEALGQGMVFSGSAPLSFSDDVAIGWKWDFDADDSYLSAHPEEIDNLKAKIILTVVATQVK